MDSTLKYLFCIKNNSICISYSLIIFSEIEIVGVDSKKCQLKHRPFCVQGLHSVVQYQHMDSIAWEKKTQIL